MCLETRSSVLICFYFCMTLTWNFVLFLFLLLLHKQVWYSNPSLRNWLKEHANKSQLDKLKWNYYQVNKSPWYVSCRVTLFVHTPVCLVRFSSRPNVQESYQVNIQFTNSLRPRNPAAS